MKYTVCPGKRVLKKKDEREAPNAMVLGSKTKKLSPKIPKLGRGFIYPTYIFLKTLQLGSFLSLFQHVSLGFRIVQVGGTDLLQTGHGEIRPATTRAAHRHPVGQCSARGGTLLFLSNHLTNHV